MDLYWSTSRYQSFDQSDEPVSKAELNDRGPAPLYWNNETYITYSGSFCASPNCKHSPVSQGLVTEFYRFTRSSKPYTPLQITRSSLIISLVEASRT